MLKRFHLRTRPLLAHCAQLFTIVDVRTEQPTLHEVYINTVGAVSAPVPVLAEVA